MQDSEKIDISTTIALCALTGIVTQFRANRRNRILRARLAKTTEIAQYLNDIVQRHNIELTDFDNLAITQLARELTQLHN